MRRKRSGGKVMKLLNSGYGFYTPHHLKQIQSHLLASGAFSDPYLASKIITLFTDPSCDLHHAHTLFLHLPRRTTFIWNTLLMAFTTRNLTLAAILHYKKMSAESISPNNYTFSFLLRVSAAIADLLLGSAVHAQAVKLGWEAHAFVLNGLTYFYVACSQVSSALSLLKDGRDIPDVVTWTAVIDGCLKSGDVQTARLLFDEIPEKNSVTWSAMINGCTRNGMWEEGLGLFRMMQGCGFRPNEAAIVGGLSACGYLGALEQGRWIHTYVGRSGMVIGRVLGSALVDMYGRCGCIDAACQVFDSMLQRDVFSFTSLISGLSNHGKSKEAIEVFKRMEKDGVLPNEVTFICVLSACSRMGMVAEGVRIFDKMVSFYGLEPGVEHYGCLVDLLGRAGMMEEAKEVVKKMGKEPDHYVLGALLNACRVHGDVELGEETAASLVERRMEHGGSLVLLSNIYAWESMWDEVGRVRKGMEEKEVEKVPGCSSVQVDGAVFEFVAGRNSHGLNGRILPVLVATDKHLRSSSIHDNDDDDVVVH